MFPVFSLVCCFADIVPNIKSDKADVKHHIESGAYVLYPPPILDVKRWTYIHLWLTLCLISVD